MTNDNSYIDNLIAEATAEIAAADTDVETKVSAEKAVVNENETAENESDVKKSDNDNDADESDDDSDSDSDDATEFPKKAKNALSRQRKLVTKERAKNAELSRRLAELEQLVGSRNAERGGNGNFDPDEPREEQFDDYGQFLEAKIIHKLTKENLAKQSETQKQQAVQEQERLAQESFLRVQKATVNFVKSVPDALAVFSEYRETLDSFPQEIQQVMYELGDDLPLAVYNLARSGKLDDLAELSPARAAIEIGRAVAKSAKAQTVNKVSGAPIPPAHVAKGTGSPSNREISGRMSADELYKWTMNK